MYCCLFANLLEGCWSVRWTWWLCSQSVPIHPNQFLNPIQSSTACLSIYLNPFLPFLQTSSWKRGTRV
jgi:hypothetical protein